MENIVDYTLYIFSNIIYSSKCEYFNIIYNIFGFKLPLVTFWFLIESLLCFIE